MMPTKKNILNFKIKHKVNGTFEQILIHLFEFVYNIEVCIKKKEKDTY